MEQVGIGLLCGAVLGCSGDSPVAAPLLGAGSSTVRVITITDRPFASPSVSPQHSGAIIGDQIEFRISTAFPSSCGITFRSDSKYVILPDKVSKSTESRTVRREVLAIRQPMGQLLTFSANCGVVGGTRGSINIW